MSRRTQPRRERGALSLELVLIAPVVFTMLMLTAAALRYSEASSQVEHTAWDVARAASLTTSSAAPEAGQQAASRALVDRGVECRNLRVTVDTSEMVPGGSVTATIVCTADLSDLTVPGVPGSKTVAATAVVPIEPWRG